MGVDVLAQGLAAAQPLTSWVSQARPFVLRLCELEQSGTP